MALRNAIIANMHVPPESRKTGADIAKEFGTTQRSVYGITRRIKKERGEIPTTGEIFRENRKAEYDSVVVGNVDGIHIPSRAQRRAILATIIATGTNPDRQAAIHKLNAMDEEDSSREAVAAPETREEAVECLYRILCAAPPDILEEALAKRQTDLERPEAPPEASISDIQEDTGLPSGGGGVE